MTSLPRTRCAARSIAKTKGANHKRAKIWYAMRVMRHFTIADLMAVTEQDNKYSILTFIGYLRRAGYVIARYGNKGKHELTSFVLVRNTGPKCPSILRNGKTIWDHNTEQEIVINDTSE